MNDMTLMTETLKEAASMGEFKRLRHKQEQFCLRYVVHGNGARAARESGYSKKSAASVACDLLQREDVKHYIDVFLSIKRKRNVVSVPFLHAYVMGILKDPDASPSFKLKVAEGLGLKLATLSKDETDPDMKIGEEGFLSITEGVDPAEDSMVYLTDTAMEMIDHVEVKALKTKGDIA